MSKRISFSDLILFEDDNLLVINKPPQIASLHDRSSPINIQDMAREHYADAQLCHRLDKETSGCLILSKNADTYRYISILFEERQVKKLYLAVVEGVHSFEEEIIDAPIYSKKNGDAVIDFYNGKESATIVNSVKHYNGYTLVQAMPITGRLHQIRVHLSLRDAPIVADEKYGGHPFYLSSIKKKYHLGKYQEERPLIKRVALHSFKVSFPTQSGEELTVEAPYPKDFAVLLRQLEKSVN